MSNNHFLLEPKYEVLELVLDVDDSRISSKELRAYLLQLETLVNSVNKTLKKHGEGFDSVSIDVLPFERGSFKLPLSLRKIKDLTDNSTVGSIIGGVIVALLMNNSPYTMDYRGPETNGIPTKEYLENIDTKKAVKKIAELVLYNDSIHNLLVTYESSEGKQEKITISKESLIDTRCLMGSIIDDYEMSEYLLEKESLQIISPSLGDGPNVSWKFIFQGKMIIAKMCDRDFQEDFNAGEITFKKGNELLVDMVVVRRGENKEKYYITKVYRPGIN